METNTGTVKQVMGPVVDVEFTHGNVPDLMTALHVTNPAIDERDDNLTLEVALHLGENTVRTIAMDTTTVSSAEWLYATVGHPLICPLAEVFWAEFLTSPATPLMNWDPFKPYLLAHPQTRSDFTSNRPASKCSKPELRL